MLRAEPEDGALSTRLGQPHRGAGRGCRSRRRRHRFALGAADRRLRRGRRPSVRGSRDVIALRHRRMATLPGLSPGWLAAGLGTVLVSALVALAAGPVDLGVGAIARELLSHVPFLDVKSPLSKTEDAILWQIRMPRVALGLLVGAMLASAGAAYQGVFRNPLADPYLLGAAAGAGLGATVIIAYAPSTSGWPIDPVPLAAFVGAILAVGLSYLVATTADRRGSSATVLLAGIAVAAFFTALQTYVQQQNSD